ncbi:hypothetical protein E4U43_004189, partial [Claviceps pusilla]
MPASDANAGTGDLIATMHRFTHDELDELCGEAGGQTPAWVPLHPIKALSSCSLLDLRGRWRHAESSELNIMASSRQKAGNYPSYCST